MDRANMTEDEKTEAWRTFHAEHIQRQTKATEQIRNYVTIWFWLSIVGAVLFVALSAAAANQY